MTLEDSYTHCKNIAFSHYENFPVASRLIPARLRPHVAAVYAFSRYADDIVDEGIFSPSDRKQHLDDWRTKLTQCETSPDGPIFHALAHTIAEFGLDTHPFHALLDAFEQDIFQSRYENFSDVLHYCERSANPVGRIMLALFGASNATTIPPADSLCTGLQLANFWQDISVDILKDRVYIPAEDMQQFGVPESVLSEKSANSAFRKLVQFEVNRTKKYFEDAVKLFPHVPLRLRLELKAIWRGGMAILQSIEQAGYDVLSQRPSLSKAQYASILAGSFFPIPSQTP